VHARDWHAEDGERSESTIWILLLSAHECPLRFRMTYSAPRRSPPRLSPISSTTNSLIKVFRRALKDGITSDGWVGVEGPLGINEILQAGAAGLPPHLLRSRSRIRSVLVSEGSAAKYEPLLARLGADVEIAQAQDRVFLTIAQTVNPQGIAALVEVHPPDLSSVLAQRNVLLVVACGLQEPGNLGTITRTAEAFGAAALLALMSTVSVFNPKAVRASGGAVFRLPVYPGMQAGQAFDLLVNGGIGIAAADPHGEAQLPGPDLRGPLAVLIGNERAGLDSEIASHANLRLRIPIRFEVNSINAAISAGILLYEAARQRGFRY
jgi:RNA methyltransferase, TrmH family